MNAKSLYEEDFHAWALEQARVLRELGARGVALPNDLDLDHVAEEVEDLGNEQRIQVESNITQAWMHLIKAAARPDDQAVQHWLGETLTFLANARKRYRPSMRRLIDDCDLWADAVARVTELAHLQGWQAPTFPAAPPIALEHMLASPADVLAFVEQVRSTIATSP
jgi:hypothetical protein